MIQAIRSIAKHLLPPAARGPALYHLQPHLCDGWGGPLNGQCYRQLIVKELLETGNFSCIVETGTFRGTTTLFFAKNTSIPIYSVEFDPTYFHFAKYRLKQYPTITLQRNDSRAFLRSLKLDRDKRVFFYLDAHWNADLPLQEEVSYIADTFADFVIMIDDFQVPGDAGYMFDDYGPGKQLGLRDFAFHEDDALVCYFPRRASALESGAKRGCVVLASTSSAGMVDRIESLVRFQPA